MRKVKKIMALLLTLAMVMGLSLTAFAGTKTTATITIKDEKGSVLALYNEDSNPTGVALSYAQIIVPDTKTRTGWAFVGNTSADPVKDMKITDAFTTAFGVLDDQAAIDRLIATTKDNDNIATSNTEELSNAFSDILESGILFTKATANPFTVNKAGVYLVKATQEGYTYNTMAAYVGFGEVTVDDTQYQYPSLVDVEITAKRSPESVVKKVDDPDNVVAVGDIVTYTIEAYVPFFDAKAQNKTFKIVDSIYGATYYLTGENSVAKVVMDGKADPVADAGDFVIVDNSFDIDLSDLITVDNRNAGKKITVTYTAKVDGTLEDAEGNGYMVENTASTHVGDAHHDSDPVKVYTGTVILTKTDVDDKNKKLAGAGFEVRKNDDENTLKFTKLDEGLYVYDKNGAVTEVVTNGDGLVILKGLDVGTYKFKEVTAPEGYHIANTPGGVDVTATLTVTNKADSVIVDEQELTNTKLSSLPGTGGIGTTIFTIGGCVIMIAAAGLYFASRRKTDAK